MKCMQLATHSLNLKLVDELRRDIKVKTRVSNGIIYQPGNIELITEKKIRICGQVQAQQLPVNRSKL